MVAHWLYLPLSFGNLSLLLPFMKSHLGSHLPLIVIIIRRILRLVDVDFLSRVPMVVMVSFFVADDPQDLHLRAEMRQHKVNLDGLL